MGDVDLTLTLELVQDAQAGNREALNRLLDRYSDRVRTIIRLRLGSKLRERVDSVDILQETLIEAIQGFDRFEMRDEGSLINWLSKLAERKILNARDFHAALKRDFTRDVAFDAQVEHQMRSSRDTPTPADEVESVERNHMIEACLEQLPELYREVIILRDYAGATWKTVAEQLEKPSEDSVRMLHARALIALGKVARNAGLD